MAPTKQSATEYPDLPGEKQHHEYIEVHDLDGTRKLLVPSNEPKKIPGVYRLSEFKSLQERARIITPAEKLSILEEADRQKNELIKESYERKMNLKKSQIIQKAEINSTLSNVERQAKNKQLYLLERSYNMIQEQDQRVKNANRILIATKCKAIRNAQIAEKELIAKQLQEEEQRLDAMMEQRRQGEIIKEENKKDENKVKKQEYINELLRQMKYNETEKLMETERLKDEHKVSNQIFQAMRKEDEENYLKMKKQQEQMRNELKKASEDLQYYKQKQLENEKFNDMKIQAYIKQKQEREEQREKQIAQAKREKEQEIGRMRHLQGAQQDHKARMNEINALRIQEEVDRQWRENELKAAQKRKEQIEQLGKEREQHVSNLCQARAIRLALDEEDFHKVVKIQREQYNKEQEKKQKTKEMSLKHCKDLLLQINEKEKQRIKEKQEKYIEGRNQMKEQEMQDRRIKEYLEKKIQVFKNNPILKNYVNDVTSEIERQFKK